MMFFKTDRKRDVGKMDGRDLSVQKNPPENHSDKDKKKQKTKMDKNHCMCWNDRAAAGKGKPTAPVGIYDRAGTKMGTRLLIDHFQLRADLRVNAERFHQVAAFQRQCKQQQKKCSCLSRLMEMTRCYQLSRREDACVHGDTKKKYTVAALPDARVRPGGGRILQNTWHLMVWPVNPAIHASRQLVTNLSTSSHVHFYCFFAAFPLRRRQRNWAQR